MPKTASNKRAKVSTSVAHSFSSIPTSHLPHTMGVLQFLKDLVCGSDQKRLYQLFHDKHGEIISIIDSEGNFQRLRDYKSISDDELVKIVADLVQKAENYQSECHEVLSDWNRSKGSLESDSEKGILELQGIIRVLNDYVNAETPLQRTIKGHYNEMEKRKTEMETKGKSVFQHMKRYETSKLKSLEYQHEIDKNSLSEQWNNIQDQESNALNSIMSSDLMNLYVIQPPECNIISLIQQSSVKKVCNKVCEWGEDKDVSQCVAPFVIVHGIFFGSEMFVPPSAEKLFNETEKHGGAYLVMRVHKGEHLFNSDEFDTNIPSGIGGVATVLKASYLTTTNLAGDGGFTREFKDTTRCFEPPAAQAQDPIRNLYFLLVNNSLLSKYRLARVQARPAVSLS